MGEFLSRFVDIVSRSMFTDTTVKTSQGPTLADATVKALEDWRSAEQCFNLVNDPDLVDHAIYTIEASRKRYIYLLHRLRQGCDPSSRVY